MNYRTASIQLVLFFLLQTAAVAQKYLEVTEFYAKVYVAPSATSQFIGLAQKGEKYQMIGTSGPWYRIHFKNTSGWVYKGNITIANAATTPSAPAVKSAPTVPTTPAVSASQQSSPSMTPPEETAPPEAASIQSNLSDTQEPVEGRPSPATVSPEQSRQARVTPPPEPPPAQRRFFFRRSRQQQEPSLSPPEEEPSKRIIRKSGWSTPALAPLPEVPSDSSPVPKVDPLYFQVVTGPVRVIAYLSPDSPILGMVRSGELLPLVAEGDSWCRVAYGDSLGWIERRYGKIVTAPTSLLAEQFKIVVVIVLILLAIGLIATVLYIIKQRGTTSSGKQLSLRKNVLMIAKGQKSIQVTLTNLSTTLEKCFEEIGFNVLIARDLVSARNHIDHSLPDVVMVDWHFDRRILTAIEHLFSKRTSLSNALFIFYNVPDPAGIPASRTLPNVQFLGISFTDRDIFKLVTPLIITSERSKTIQKSVQSSALEGEIENRNLEEVLQYIEIGSKTGCLMVETQSPFGIIYFVQGRIVYAAAENKIGKNAIFTLLNLKTGKFRFLIDRMPKQTNMNLSAIEVLMERAKELDETHRR
jgi:hypothetical protein